MTRPHTVYSVGYSGFPHDALLDLIRARNLLLIDVRLKPASRFQPHWNRNALAAALPERYGWLPELGNLNYKGDGPVRLQDERTGLVKLRQLLESRDIALLCACSDPATCHRTFISDILAREGYPVVHLPAPPRATASKSAPRLF